MQSIGKNISMELDGDILTLRIDLSKDFGDSGSGKTTIIATTGSPTRIDDHPRKPKLTITVFQPKPKSKKETTD